MQNELIAGDSLNFLTTTPGYSAADGWVLKFRLVPRTASNAAIPITAVAEGDDHRVQLTAAGTANWAADTYGWAAWVEKGAEQYTVQTGQIVVKPNPRTAAAGVDTRSQARKALDQFKAAYAAYTPTKRSYQVGDRQMEFNSAADIQRHISYWQLQVNREEAAGDSTQAALSSGRFYIRALR